MHCLLIIFSNKYLPVLEFNQLIDTKRSLVRLPVVNLHRSFLSAGGFSVLMGYCFNKVASLNHLNVLLKALLAWTSFHSSKNEVFNHRYVLCSLRFVYGTIFRRW